MIFLLVIWLIVFIVMVFYLSFYKDKITRLKFQVKNQQNMLKNIENKLYQHQLGKIHKSNRKVVKIYNMDDILNEINEVGMDRLSQDKKNFLKNYKKLNSNL